MSEMSLTVRNIIRDFKAGQASRITFLKGIDF